MPSLGVAAFPALSVSKSFFYLLVCVMALTIFVIKFCKNGTVTHIFCLFICLFASLKSHSYRHVLILQL